MVTKTVSAIYENGVLRLLNPEELDLIEGQQVDVTLEVESDEVELPTENVDPYIIQLAHELAARSKREGKRLIGAHLGKFEINENFDDPLPDEFWFGKGDGESQGTTQK